MSYSEDLEKSNGLQVYVKDVAWQTGKFLGLTTLSFLASKGFGDIAMANGGLFAELTKICYFCASGLSLYSAFMVGLSKGNQSKQLYHANMMHFSLGIVIAPVMMIYQRFIPHALISAFALTMGPITASLFTSRGALLSWGPALYTALWGFVCVGFIGTISGLVGLPHTFELVQTIDLYGGIALFTLYNAYDTHKMIDDYMNGDRDKVNHSCQYSLNILNLLIRLIKMFAKIEEDKKKEDEKRKMR
jgi:FtsH-binding integral membrane protein